MDSAGTIIEDLAIIEPVIFADDRGFFMESYNKARFDAQIGREASFVQDNHSRSVEGVLRGLHYQLPPHPQGKLVRVSLGSIFDVAVDIRRSSPTFGRWMGVVLSAENRRQLWLPEGFAHGFLTLSPVAEVLYKSTDFYSPACEGSIKWDDPSIGIEWPAGKPPIISEKDAAAPRFQDAKSFA